MGTILELLKVIEKLKNNTKIYRSDRNFKEVLREEMKRLNQNEIDTKL